MKVKNLAITTFCIAPIVASANQTPIQITTDLPVFNKYVWRGVNLLNDPVFQPSVNFRFEGWNLNLWGNYDIENSKRFNEFDTTLSYSGDLAQGNWSVGYIDYAFPGSGTTQSREIFANFSFKQEFNPYIQVNFDVDEVNGLYARLGASQDVNTEAGAINFHGWIGYGDNNMNNALYGNSKSGLADFGIEATWEKQLSQNTVGYIKVGYTSLFDSKHLQGQPNRNNFTFGIGVGFGL